MPVAELTYGSEVKRDHHCPHCGAHESHHATFAGPDVYVQPCPSCRRECRVWMDKHGTPTYIGCGHVARAVVIGGELMLEFKP